jgi:hypothetical protein
MGKSTVPRGKQKGRMSVTRRLTRPFLIGQPSERLRISENNPG